MSPVPATHSQLVYDPLTNCGVRLMSALPDTWLVRLIRRAAHRGRICSFHQLSDPLA